MLILAEHTCETGMDCFKKKKRTLINVINLFDFNKYLCLGKSLLYCQIQTMSIHTEAF